MGWAASRGEGRGRAQAEATQRGGFARRRAAHKMGYVLKHTGFWKGLSFR